MGATQFDFLGSQAQTRGRGMDYRGIHSLLIVRQAALPKIYRNTVLLRLNSPISAIAWRISLLLSFHVVVLKVKSQVIVNS